MTHDSIKVVENRDTDQPEEMCRLICASVVCTYMPQGFSQGTCITAANINYDIVMKGMK